MESGLTVTSRRPTRCQRISRKLLSLWVGFWSCFRWRMLQFHTWTCSLRFFCKSEEPPFRNKQRSGFPSWWRERTRTGSKWGRWRGTGSAWELGTRCQLRWRLGFSTWRISEYCQMSTCKITLHSRECW